ncbi:hypothetical protein OSB04_015507 [Centaurea solstitialis]|uniref:UBC core domain-containing protein n=1 Tax=Centaurea solstitialis TaxID=347529 RepID=A0AA38W907_9ASTR|nr:hypothetical protein OSB04_015507 [Centaurea solstitialis]
MIQETQRLLSEPAPGISASPSEENMRYFNVMILGPSQSPYEEPKLLSKILFSKHVYMLGVFVETPSAPWGRGGVFKLELFLPEEYPMAAPKTNLSGRFGFLQKYTILTLIRSVIPNNCLRFRILGRICLDILKDKWSPALQIRTVLLSIQALLSAPNPDDPLSENVAKHWKTNEADAVETAKEWTHLYASGT